MRINMVLYRKLWNYGFTKEKTWQINKNQETLIDNEKNYDIIPKQLKFCEQILYL